MGKGCLHGYLILFSSASDEFISFRRKITNVSRFHLGPRDWRPAEQKRESASQLGPSGLSAGPGSRPNGAVNATDHESDIFVVVVAIAYILGL